MPELAERKVLKKMLLKLKAQIIARQQSYYKLSSDLSQSMEEGLKKYLVETSKMPEGEVKTQSLLLATVVNGITQNYNMLGSSVTSLIGDMNLYIETLESYSIELDNTLGDIFKEAEKRVEEQQTQQEELRKKEPSYRA